MCKRLHRSLISEANISLCNVGVSVRLGRYSHERATFGLLVEVRPTAWLLANGENPLIKHWRVTVAYRLQPFSDHLSQVAR